MSVAENGQHIICDGPGCSATARLPVGLRSRLAQSSAVDAKTVEGWLFVTSRGRPRHYCHRCGPRYLGELPEETAADKLAPSAFPGLSEMREAF